MSISTLILKHSFTGHKILGWQFFYQHFFDNFFMTVLLTSMVSERSAVILWGLHSKWGLISLAAFRFFSLSFSILLWCVWMRIPFCLPYLEFIKVLYAYNSIVFLLSSLSSLLPVLLQHMFVLSVCPHFSKAPLYFLHSFFYFAGLHDTYQSFFEFISYSFD